jgi:hypothetical protein
MSAEMAAGRVMELLDRHFTAAQLEALTRFHEPAEGQAVYDDVPDGAILRRAHPPADVP